MESNWSAVLNAHKSRLMRGFRQKIAFAHDIIMAMLSIPISLFLRLGNEIFYYEHQLIFTSAALFTIVAALTFWSMHLYSGVWRYASVNDLVAITRAVTLVILVFLPLMFLFNRLEAFPRSALLINWFVLMSLLGGPRFIYRQFKEKYGEQPDANGNVKRVPVLLIGAGDSTEMFIRALARNKSSAYRIVGIVDEKENRVGQKIQGVRVEGTLNNIADTLTRISLKDQRPQRLIVTNEKIKKDAMHRLLEISEREKIAIARMPSLTDFRDEGRDQTEIKPVAIEDVLGRAQQVLDRYSMQKLIAGQKILITGAGGTIGSELVRQAAAFGPKQICMLDNSEYAIYKINFELSTKYEKINQKSMIADIRDKKRIIDIFSREKPDIVFHAAALKHVPIVEDHPREGVLTNVLGTQIVAEACIKIKAKAMVLISTDKAVNPTSIMGATKRIAESWCQALALEQKKLHKRTHFVAVRFGNVLGSTGSVVPLFQKQLANGGPLTVTHRDMTRYFMTVSEAVELVLEATVLGTRSNAEAGHIYVLDMGEPIKIIDLARQMILLSGLRPDKDIKIQFTGLRPGEKLFEEIFHDSEPPSKTEYEGIMLATPRAVEKNCVADFIRNLINAAEENDTNLIFKLIEKNVPEYEKTAYYIPKDRVK
ncbi:MAG: nucleotide sugar dehydratase [Rhodospirillaceae bacterium]|nr:nucleotide sugar dehydratase [Rhodospirillaceae bacterium]